MLGLNKRAASSACFSFISPSQYFLQNSDVLSFLQVIKHLNYLKATKIKEASYPALFLHPFISSLWVMFPPLFSLARTHSHANTQKIKQVSALFAFPPLFFLSLFLPSCV